MKPTSYNINGMTVSFVALDQIRLNPFFTVIPHCAPNTEIGPFGSEQEAYNFGVLYCSKRGVLCEYRRMEWADVIPHLTPKLRAAITKAARCPPRFELQDPAQF
jgi:hypothetical protein